jgi:excisionase family DNA binding protein
VEEMLLDFLVILLFVFMLSAFIMVLGTRPPAVSLQGASLMGLDDANRGASSGDMEELAEQISRDEDLLKPAPPVNIPAVSLPGAKLGGGAVGESCSKATAVIALVVDEDPSEKREYNRRLNDRRSTEHQIEQDRRLIQRRVWLRREEDQKGKKLLNITDAAETLGVSIEQVYKWLDNSDIPFYQVTEGKRRALRFEIDELLHWHSHFARRAGGDSPKT